MVISRVTPFRALITLFITYLLSPLPRQVEPDFFKEDSNLRILFPKANGSLVTVRKKPSTVNPYAPKARNLPKKPRIPKDLHPRNLRLLCGRRWGWLPRSCVLLRRRRWELGREGCRYHYWYDIGTIVSINVSATSRASAIARTRTTSTSTSTVRVRVVVLVLASTSMSLSIYVRIHIRIRSTLATSISVCISTISIVFVFKIE